MSQSSKAKHPHKPYVIGEEMAAATRAEQKRLQLGDYEKSPMPKATYDRWRGELSLVSLRRLPLDTGIADLCAAFRLAKVPTRQTMRRSISMDESYTLLTFSQRSAVFAIREQRIEDVLDGLTAVAMVEAERVDFRDVLVALSLLHHAATRTGADEQRQFDTRRNWQSLAPPRWSQSLRADVHRIGTCETLGVMTRCGPMTVSGLFGGASNPTIRRVT